MLEAETPSRLNAAVEVRWAANAYCEAAHAGDVAVCRDVFHENCHLYGIAADGSLIDMPRETFLERVAARSGEGPADYEIHDVTVTGEMAVVRLSVTLAPRRFEDQLNFLKFGDEWRVIAKLFRVADGPAL